MILELSNNASLAEICGVGILLGIVHVLTGPDHLTALSTLVTGKPFRHSFFVGVRWGLGHSTGLLIIAIVFFSISQSMEFLDENGKIAMKIVGVIMILLGVYGWYDAYKMKMKTTNATNMTTTVDDSTEMVQNSILVRDTPSSVVEYNPSISSRETPDTLIASGNSNRLQSQEMIINIEYSNTNTSPDSSPINECKSDTITANQNDIIDNESSLLIEEEKSKQFCSLRNSKCVNLISFLVGIIHGISGPGGVLGVLPAIALHDPLKSALYLILFMLSSILIMGLFAGIFGYLTCVLQSTTKVDSMLFYLCILTSTLSFIVGILIFSCDECDI